MEKSKINIVMRMCLMWHMTFAVYVWYSEFSLRILAYLER